MENISLWVKLAVAATAAAVGELLGRWDKLLTFLLICMAFDIVSGFMKAAAHNSIDSRAMYVGAFKKIGMMLVVGLAHGIDGLLITDTLMRSAVIGYFIATEGISILENVGEMGIELPPKLMEILQKFRQINEGSGKDV